MFEGQNSEGSSANAVRIAQEDRTVGESDDSTGTAEKKRKRSKASKGRSTENVQSEGNSKGEGPSNVGGADVDAVGGGRKESGTGNANGWKRDKRVFLLFVP